MKEDKLKTLAGRDPRDIALELLTGQPSNKHGSISSDEWDKLSPEERKVDTRGLAYENGMLIIETTGHVSVGINAEGLPAFESVVPCPMKPIDKREQEVQEAKDTIYMSGYFITAEKLIRNEAFDKPGEKTTTQISFRTCKNEEEAKYVMGKVKHIVERS